MAEGGSLRVVDRLAGGVYLAAPGSSSSQRAGIAHTPGHYDAHARAADAGSTHPYTGAGVNTAFTGSAG